MNLKNIKAVESEQNQVVMRLAWVVLAVCWYVGSARADARVNELGSIRQVAGPFINELYRDDELDVFILTLPPKAVLPDHQTGPRIIVLLTDLSGERLADKSQFSAQKDQVFYLSNAFSAGFINHTDQAAKYLVVGLKHELLSAESPEQCLHKGLQWVKTQGAVRVCRLNKPTARMNAQTRGIMYQSKHESVVVFDKQATVDITQGDWVIELN